MKQSPILSVKNLNVSIISKGIVSNIVNDLSFNVKRGEILSIVGESGSGKSMTAKAILRLLPQNSLVSGKVLFENDNLLDLNEKNVRKIRGSGIGMIFQEPMTALNPVLSIGKQMTEALVINGVCSQKEANERAIEMLDRVSITEPKKRMKQFPHEFSGGMRQRMLIAMVMLIEPQLLIADEPTTALDVTIQAQILDLLSSLVSETNIGLVIITHDMGVVAETADNVLVMKGGKEVEHAEVNNLFKKPTKPYTKSLLAAVPRLDIKTFENQTSSNTSTTPLVKINQVSKTFSKDNYLFFDSLKTHALDNVSLEIKYGETVALVGESGSGKSTLGRAIVKLENIDSGDIIVDSLNINSSKSDDLKNLRSNAQIIFQDPYSSLDPRYSVGRSIAEPILIQRQCSRSEAKDRVSVLLKSVGLTNEMANRYPHEFSGGQRQRIAIARALASEPKFIVADEPTSALDVTIQAQILELLNNLKNEKNISLLFITHDLAVVRQISNQVAVMCQGKILEKGPTDSVLDNPQNDYTKSLLSAAPYPDPGKRKKLKRNINLKSFNTGPLIEIANNHWAAS